VAGIHRTGYSLQGATQFWTLSAGTMIYVDVGDISIKAKTIRYSCMISGGTRAIPKPNNEWLRRRWCLGTAGCEVSVFPVIPPPGETQVEVRQLKTPVG